MSEPYFTVEKDVPPPQPRRGRGGPQFAGSGLKHAIAGLAVGECVFLPEASGLKTSASQLLTAAVTNARKLPGIAIRRFIVRQVGGGARCWRLQ